MYYVRQEGDTQTGVCTFLLPLITSVSLMISCNCLDQALVQPLIRITQLLDLVNLKNLPRWRGGKLVMVGMFVLCCALIYILIPM
jgi:hypothetical protein